MSLLGIPIFHHCTKFCGKMLIDAEIMAEIEIQDGGRLASSIVLLNILRAL